jgi:hypothetical protein
MPHPDDCPNPDCDARIEHHHSHSVGRGPEEQVDICPKCRTRVRRRVGGAWNVDTTPPPPAH